MHEFQWQALELSEIGLDDETVELLDQNDMKTVGNVWKFLKAGNELETLGLEPGPINQLHTYITTVSPDVVPAAPRRDDAPPEAKMELLEAIQAQYREVQRLERICGLKAEQYKLAKDEHKEAIQELLAIIGDGPERQLKLPFDATAPVAKPDDWESFPLGGLGLPAKTVKLLKESKLTTMGELASYTAKKPLADIPGIGEAAAKKIDAATEAFWANRDVLTITA
jgi:hypothetical protein